MWRSAGTIRKTDSARRFTRRPLSILTTRRPCTGRGLLYQGEKQHQLASTISRGEWPDAERAEPLTGSRGQLPRGTRSTRPLPISTRAVQADPQNAQIWITRGLAYERLGDKTKAAGS